MPVSVVSRYYGSPVYSAVDESRTSHPTIAIRSTPATDPNQTQYNHVVTGLETIEYLAWRYYGDSTLWWQIADANGLAFPTDLAPGMSIAVPAIQGFGTIVRSRTFS